MLKYIFALLFSATLVFGTTGCSLFGGSGDDTEQAEAAEMAADEDIEGFDEEGQEGASEDSGGDVTESSADKGASEESGGDDFAEGDDAFGDDEGDADFSEGDEEVVADLGEDDLEPGGEADEDPFAEDTAGADEDPFAEEGQKEDIAEQPPADEVPAEVAINDSEEAPPVDEFAQQEPVQEDLSAMADGSDQQAFDQEPMDMPADSEIPMERTWVPVKKIADTPFQKNGTLVNAVYLARDGDTIESVSQKIYGSDRAEDLYNVNPSYRNSSLDVGEKVYYNSPNRPADSSSLKTFYEDMGLAPEVYISKEGDNIRAVSKELLGHKDSWKEVWATNSDVDSKSEIASGLQLRYWPGGEVSSVPPVAMNDGPSADEPPPMPDMPNEPPPMPEPPEMTPPPPEPPAPDMAEMTPPPPPPPAAMGSVDPPPPPPPAAAAAVDPPPPPPPMAKKKPRKKLSQASTGGEDEQVLMMAVGAGLVLTAMILFILIRKKKARRQIDFNTATQTQIE